MFSGGLEKFCYTGKLNIWGAWNLVEWDPIRDYVYSDDIAIFWVQQKTNRACCQALTAWYFLILDNETKIWFAPTLSGEPLSSERDEFFKMTKILPGKVSPKKIITSCLNEQFPLITLVLYLKTLFLLLDEIFRPVKVTNFSFGDKNAARRIVFL